MMLMFGVYSDALLIGRNNIFRYANRVLAYSAQEAAEIILDRHKNYRHALLADILHVGPIGLIHPNYLDGLCRDLSLDLELLFSDSSEGRLVFERYIEFWSYPTEQAQRALDVFDRERQDFLRTSKEVYDMLVEIIPAQKLTLVPPKALPRRILELG